MKVIKFNKDSVSPEDICDHLQEVVVTGKVKRVAIVVEFDDTSIQIAHSDGNVADFYVMGGVLQDYAMGEMRFND